MTRKGKLATVEAPPAPTIRPEVRDVALASGSYLRVQPQRNTVEIWLDWRAKGFTSCLLALTPDQAGELAAALTWAKSRVDRNLRVAAVEPGVYGVRKGE